MGSITKNFGLALTGDQGPVGSGTVSFTREVEEILTDKFNHRSVALTSSNEDLDIGDVDTSKVYQVLVWNTAATTATNYVVVSYYDGTNTIVAHRILPQDGMVVPMEPQTAGNPRIRLKMDSGTGNVTIKVLEAGTPPAA